ncbi:MAG TPA: DUF1801 domain-containing protein [Candidatus Cryosericum sp.]|nr:DUF1801 domain-containing protein [Candidatus Cryosericum sp.]
MSTPITDYILQFPADVQQKLNELRTTILEIVPDATEKIAYGIPTFYVKGNLVHFAAYKHHIGFYPGASGIETFQSELTQYKLSRGTVQFPLDQPLPMELIRRIVKYRLAENLAK